MTFRRIRWFLLHYRGRSSLRVFKYTIAPFNPPTNQRTRGYIHAPSLEDITGERVSLHSEFTASSISEKLSNDRPAIAKPFVCDKAGFCAASSCQIKFTNECMFEIVI